MGTITIEISGQLVADVMRHTGSAWLQTAGQTLPDDTKIKRAEYDYRLGLFRITAESAAFPDEEVAR